MTPLQARAARSVVELAKPPFVLRQRQRANEEAHEAGGVADEEALAHQRPVSEQRRGIVEDDDVDASRVFELGR